MDRQKIWNLAMPFTEYGSFIRGYLENFVSKFKKIIIYGTGADTLSLVEMLSNICDLPINFCDRKAETKKYSYQGKTVIPPTELYGTFTEEFVGIIISSGKYGDEIKDELLKHGVKEDRICNLKVDWEEVYDGSERMVCFGGNNEDKIFYVIRNRGNIGLMSQFVTNLGHINYAESKGYIPVIDMKNYLNGYLEYDELGKINAWDFYFEQPFGNCYTLDEIYESKNVVFCGLKKQINRPDVGMVFFQNKSERNFWKEIYEKHIPVNAEIAKRVCDEYEALLKPVHSRKKKILGTLLRGTDYWKLKPKQHPVQPDIVTAIHEIQSAMQMWGCQYLYLVTEDTTISREIVKFFGTKVIMSEQSEIAYEDGYIINSINTSKYERGRNYLVALMLLSKCNSFIGGRTSGSLALSIMKTDFEHESFFDYGYY